MTELRLDDRVVGISIRYVGLRTDDGQRVRLKGTGVASLVSGSRVQASGRREGDTLFAGDVRVTDISPAGAAPRAKVEQSVEGRYTLVIGDDFDAGRASYEHTVIDDAGRMTPVAFAVMPDVLHNGMRVVVSGTRGADGESIEADQVTILALAPSRDVARSGAGIAATAQSIAILVKFTDTATEPFTQAAVQTLMYGGPGTNSVAEFYKEASYGQQLVSGVVTPWLQLSIAAPTTCTYSSIGTAADTAATAAGYNLASYTHRVYFFPRVSSCGWSGLATVGGGRAWINQSASLLVVAHELGHNFGALHAASLDCGNAVIGGTCTSSAYGDSFNVMGNQRAMHFAAFQKFDFAWITTSNVATHASGVATYTLSPVESAGGTTYAVKIPARTNRTYWLEFRRPLGFDAGLSSFPNNGVQMRVASPFESICSGCSDDTELLDATPAHLGAHRRHAGGGQGLRRLGHRLHRLGARGHVHHRAGTGRERRSAQASRLQPRSQDRAPLAQCDERRDVAVAHERHGAERAARSSWPIRTGASRTSAISTATAGPTSSGATTPPARPRSGS